MPALLVTEDRVLDALRQVIDPEIGEDLVELGLIYGVTIEDGHVSVDMTLTTQGCPLHESLCEAARRAIDMYVPGVDQIDVNLVWCPAWTPERISPAARKRLGWC